MICFDKKGKKKPKKPCYKLLALALVVFMVAEAQAQTVAKDLIGLGMKPEQADYLADILPAGSVLGNNTYLKGRNAANSADIDMMKITTGDDLLINSDSGDFIQFQIGSDPQRVFNMNASSDTAIEFTYGDGGTTATQVFSIMSTTGDADDDSTIHVGGGGTASATRGGFLSAKGNELATTGGAVSLTGGAIATGNIDMNISHASAAFRVINSSAATTWSIGDSGNMTAGTGGGHIIMDVQDKNFYNISGLGSIDADVTTVATAATTTAYLASNSSGNNFVIVSNIADTVGGNIIGMKTRAAANASNANTIISSGDDILSITAYGADGAAYINAAQILMESGGTPGLTTDMPGNIKFLTTPDGSGTLTLAVTIEPDQDLLLTGDIYLADGQNLGWTGASGANTACDTTCTSGCIAGWDTGTSVFVACTNAIADTCLCTK